VLRLARALPIGARILEVGSGVEGLGTWYRGPFVGVDLAFLGPRLPTLHPVVADGARLPFPDRCFDLVANVDVLPELPRDIVGPMCTELARVARGHVVVVSVSGTDAVRSDRRMLDWCRRHHFTPPEWLVHHVEFNLPTVREIEAALQAYGRVTILPNTSTTWNERLFKTEHRLRRIHAMSAIQPPLRLAGRIAPIDARGSGPVYRWTFRLDTQATASPPMRRS
jgi:hypothetical protein